jgi:hypothetical protein
MQAPYNVKEISMANKMHLERALKENKVKGRGRELKEKKVERNIEKRRKGKQ